MKRLSLFVAAAAASLALFAMPALAAVPDAGPIAIERLDCTTADLSPADFPAAIVSPAEWFGCDTLLLAATGLCIVAVEPARVGFAFVPPPDRLAAPASGACSPGRSPTG